MKCKFSHPYLGLIGITEKNQLVRNDSVISSPLKDTQNALAQLEEYIKLEMTNQENSLFDELKRVHDIKNSRLVEFEIV